VGRIPTLYFFRRKKEKTKQKNRRLYVFALIRKSQSDKAEPRPFSPSAPAPTAAVWFGIFCFSLQKLPKNYNMLQGFLFFFYFMQSADVLISRQVS
jgi:hypothetical protein